MLRQELEDLGVPPLLVTLEADRLRQEGVLLVSPRDCTLTAVAASVRVASFQTGMSFRR
jgi:hypothetical protein